MPRKLVSLVSRLREVRCNREPFTPDHEGCVCRLANEAADELERLRARAGKAELTIGRVLDALGVKR